MNFVSRRPDKSLIASSWDEPRSEAEPGDGKDLRAVGPSSSGLEAAARTRRAVNSFWVSVFARVTNFAVAIALVPITIQYLGKVQYGVWMTIVSIAGYLSLSDAGVGNVLVSRVARAEARSDEKSITRDVSAALAICLVTSSSAAILLAAAYVWLPWAALFNVEPGSSTEHVARLAAAALISIFLIRIPLDLVISIRRGLQQGPVNSGISMLTGFLEIIFVVVAVKLGQGLPMIVAMSTIGLLLGSALNWALLLRRRPYCRPRLGAMSWSGMRSLSHQGSLFLTLQVAALVAYSSDNFVATQVLGPEAVASYAVPAQLAFGGMGFISLVSSPLWPAYAEAAELGDYTWIKTTLRRALIVTGGLGVVGAVGLVGLGGWVVRRWTQGQVVPSTGLMAGFACWVTLGSIGGTLGMLLNALHVVKFQVVSALTMAALNLLLSIVLARRFGVAGLIWGTVLANLISTSLPYGIYVYQLLRRGIEGAVIPL